MKGKITKRVKLLITLIIVGLFVWYLILSPMLTFKNNEKKLEEAGKRYFELNSSELPTGNRVKTVTLKTLYHKSFIEGDLFMPYTKEVCSIEKSWVKVKRDNGEYKYYVFLDCGVLSSNIDHKGPEIKLEGDNEIVVGKGEEYKDPGIKKVVDNVDGKLDVKNVKTKGEVDTSKVGTYEITYKAYDSLQNAGTTKRVVNVVQKLNSTIKNDLKDGTNYTGDPDDNFIRLSNMLFRIYGIDEDNNVIIVSDEDISNVNYSKIEDWLEYYYEHLNDKTKKMIVEKKYCNMTISDTTLDITECNSYTDKKKVYIPSIVEVNKAANGRDNFMRPTTMSWIANNKNSKEAYLTREYFIVSDSAVALAYPQTDNFGVRPMMTIKGETLIAGGSGTRGDPYTLGDSAKGKSGSPVNERSTGEYISDGTVLWRVIDVLNDGTTKVISCDDIHGIDEDIKYSFGDDVDTIIYNPKDKKSVGYYINNTASKYIDTSHLVNHEIQVPIYKNKIIYGEETDVKKYKVVLSAPNMYEMFSAKQHNLSSFYSGSYWYTNSSKAENIVAATHDAGVPINERYSPFTKIGVRVVGFIKSSVVVTSGKGTFESPYIIK